MSGGVDSSVAACLLQEQGYEVIGLFMRTGTEEPADDACSSRHRGCCSAADASDARRVAGQFGIPFFALNFKDQFDQIIDYFANEYLNGRTPNPCIMCNEHLKFGRLADYGRAVGADFIATGHYARIDQPEGRCCLRRGIDGDKDQSYVLFSLDPEILSQTRLPIGEMTKEQVREHARRMGLNVSEKSESQDICFVPDRDYARVVRERYPDAFKEGSILDVEGNEIGRHEGIANYTIGQRRGLGVAMGHPVYVSAIDVKNNTVTLGEREHLASKGLAASKVNWLIDCPATSFRADVKIRYAHKAAPATVEPVGEDRIRVLFDEPQFAVTPGQAAVFYNDDLVLGGGWIDAAIR